MMLSMLVPVYNGASFLEPCIEELTRWQSEKPKLGDHRVRGRKHGGTKQLCGVLKTDILPPGHPRGTRARTGLGPFVRGVVGSWRCLVYVDVDMASDLVL